MKPSTNALARLGLVLMALVPSQQVHAVVAFDTGPGSVIGISATPFSIGYTFTATSPQNIDSLLLYDYQSDGFVNTDDFIVSVFPNNGSTTPVNGITAIFNASTTSVYTGDTPTGGRWLEVDIPDAILPPGTYRLIAQGTFDGNIGDRVLAQTTAIPAGGLTFGQPRAGSGFISPGSDPLFGTFAQGYFGPNFTTVDAPEPATATLGLLALGGMMMRRRRVA